LVNIRFLVSKGSTKGIFSTWEGRHAGELDERRIRAQRLQKRVSFSNFSLCVPRACLGKASVLRIEMAQKDVSSPLRALVRAM
jgi:hypothetical protein